MISEESRQHGAGGSRPPPILRKWARTNAGAVILAALLLPVAPAFGTATVRPEAQLSALGQLGAELFYDKRLSASGRMSCASCHSPSHAFGPPDSTSVMLGGPELETPGSRAVPSLEYLYLQPAFGIGPDGETAQSPQSTAAKLVPQGGLFWDGRVDRLDQQIDGPLYNPAEMDGGPPVRVLQKLETAPYAADFSRLFGPAIFQEPQRALDLAALAIARYELESPAFHPFTSKFDAWLAGKARFTAAERRGYRLFNDPAKGNCAACHLDKPTREEPRPLFTDFQYEALGAPRNGAIPANGNPEYYDLGLCGPFRTDLRRQTQYCGMFLTPSLRNVATRHVFFHNGVFHSLRQVLDFYVNRDLHPERFYPPDAAGGVISYDDLPKGYRANVDTVDPPFNRHSGDPPALTSGEIQDVIAFLDTLTDGYQRPGH